MWVAVLRIFHIFSVFFVFLYVCLFVFVFVFKTLYIWVILVPEFSFCSQYWEAGGLRCSWCDKPKMGILELYVAGVIFLFVSGASAQMKLGTELARTVIYLPGISGCSGQLFCLRGHRVQGRWEG